jgi:hypothetical protein
MRMVRTARGLLAEQFVSWPVLVLMREATVVNVLATTTEQLAPARTNSAHRVHVCVHVGEEY